MPSPFGLAQNSALEIPLNFEWRLVEQDRRSVAAPLPLQPVRLLRRNCIKSLDKIRAGIDAVMISRLRVAGYRRRPRSLSGTAAIFAASRSIDMDSPQ